MAQSKNPVVETEYGPVKGAIKSTALGRNFYDFSVVPYMRAPSGSLRFRDAQPPEKWTEILDAAIPRPSYPIAAFPTLNFPSCGSENAGILSVSTPYLDRKLPVAVYIHGGGFKMAFGEMEMFGLDYLLQKDVVYVSINYRVGPMGFLSLKDPELDIPGNAGLKDQVYALKWVQKNIANFGGDPDNVTVFGNSAGGASVHFLMMSDQAKGLFHKAIPLSGTSFIKAWPFAPTTELTEKLALALGWNGKNGERGILEVLENVSAFDLVEAESKLLTNEDIFAKHICFPFTPVVEPYVNERTFLPKDPVLLGREAWSKDINCMLGGTSLEGGMMLLWMKDAKFEEILRDPAGLTLARELGLDVTKPSDKQKALKYGEKLKKFYFGEGSITSDMKHQYLLYAGDLHFWHGIYRAALSRINSTGKGKTFLYRIDVSTSLNMMRVMTQSDYKGASHGDDISYLFRTKFPGLSTVGIESKEFALIKQIVSYVTSFIINGNPNNFENDGTWEPATSIELLKCFNITNDSAETVVLPELDRLKVWDEICEDANVPLY